MNNVTLGELGGEEGGVPSLSDPVSVGLRVLSGRWRTMSPPITKKKKKTIAHLP